MRRRQAVHDVALPDWWHVCIIEAWSPVERDPVRACLEWYDARRAWAADHRVPYERLPKPRETVPRFADGSRYADVRA